MNQIVWLSLGKELIFKEVKIMSKYKIVYHWSSGEIDEDDNYGDFFDTYQEAYDEASYGLQAAKEGAEILNMSNPGDYPFDEDDFEDNYFEIVEI